MSTEPNTNLSSSDEMPWADDQPQQNNIPVNTTSFSAMNLYQKINYVSDQCPPFKKTRSVLRSDGSHDYSSTTFADVLKVVNPLLSEVGLTILPIGSTVKRSNKLTEGHYTFKIINADNPSECEIIEADSQGYDSADKGANKASTAGMKYLFMRLFRLETEEDPDLISNDVYMNEGYPQQNQGNAAPAQPMTQQAPPDYHQPPVQPQNHSQQQQYEQNYQQAPQYQQQQQQVSQYNQQVPLQQGIQPLDAATKEHQQEIRAFHDRMNEIEKLRISRPDMISYLSDQIKADFNQVESLPIEPLRHANQMLANTIKTTNHGNAL